MNITIKSNGFVTGDFLDPIAYAGEKNSRVIEITHPLFPNVNYQLVVIKDHRPYLIGIQDGECIFPPSLIDIAGTLKCQFVATRKVENINDCDCTPTYSDDCADLVFKSDKFTLTVKEGLNLNGLTPMPTYEAIQDAYLNLEKAKLSVEKIKLENEEILNKITDKINEMQLNQVIIDYQKEAITRSSKDTELENKINMLLGKYEDKYEQLIKKFSNNAIKDSENNIILTNTTTISEDLTIPDNITLIIPPSVLLLLDNSITLKNEGNIKVNGIIVLGDNCTIENGNYIECQSLLDNFTFNEQSQIKLVANSSLSEYDSENVALNEIFGKNSAKLSSSSILIIEHEDKNNKFIFNVLGDIDIVSQYNIDNSIFNIKGTMNVFNILRLCNKSKINLKHNSKIIVEDQIILDNIYDGYIHFDITGEDETSHFIMGEVAEVKGLTAGYKYYYNITEKCWERMK